MAYQQRWYATGKRKTSIARVWMSSGEGQIIINKRSIVDYFGRRSLQLKIRQPLELTEAVKKYDIEANVCGGGLTGQAEAVRHGIAKALLEIDPECRGILKKAGFITRDARKKERKKYGQPGARKRYQYSKR
ncbi:MAG: 30S ribosomal protein S9 [Pseudomonadota bacterium]